MHAFNRPTVIGDPIDTDTAKRNFDDSVDYRLRQHGGRTFRDAAVDGLPHAYPFHLWVHSSLTELMLRGFPRLNEGYAFAGGWTFSSSLDAWRAVLDADFIVVSLFNDGHDPNPLWGCRASSRGVVGGGTGGAVVALIASLASLPLEKRSQVSMSSLPLPPGAIACVIHLQTSRIVWCKTTLLNDDLMLRASAQGKVDTLLDELLESGDGAPSEPPPAGPPMILIRATPVEAAEPPPPPAPDPNKPNLHAP
jgi:hypothetical protein